MSQSAVESLIGRLITDDRFRQTASKSLNKACLEMGLDLTPTEMELLSRMEINCFSDFCRCIDPGLLRAGNSSGN